MSEWCQPVVSMPLPPTYIGCIGTDAASWHSGSGHATWFTLLVCIMHSILVQEGGVWSMCRKILHANQLYLCHYSLPT
jgi:hypothetical protein